MDAGLFRVETAEEFRAIVASLEDPWSDVAMLEETFWADGGAIVYEGTDSKNQRIRAAELIRVEGDRITHITSAIAPLP